MIKKFTFDCLLMSDKFFPYSVENTHGYIIKSMKLQLRELLSSRLVQLYCSDIKKLTNACCYTVGH